MDRQTQDVNPNITNSLVSQWLVVVSEETTIIIIENPQAVAGSSYSFFSEIFLSQFLHCKEHSRIVKNQYTRNKKFEK